MTTAQKVIKYLANAFAIFLIITIIYSILIAGYNLIKSFGLVNKKQEEIPTELKVISNEVIDIKTLKIDLETTSLEIKTNDVFKVETNNSEISFLNNDGNVKIKEKHQNLLKSKSTNTLIIYIPKDIEILDETEINTGAGDVKISKLNTKELKLELGAGSLNINNLKVTQKAKINGGVGETNLESCEINNLIADLGMGEFKLKGKITGKNKINSGVGAINIKLIDDKNNYTVDISKGVGKTTIDGKEIQKDGVYGEGENLLDINGGVGKIEIEFN